MKRNMKAVLKMVASASMLFALVFIALDSSAAVAAVARQPETYCMSYDEGGTDCGFASFAQCQASASGRQASCFRGPSGDDAASFSNANAQLTPVRHSK